MFADRQLDLRHALGDGQAPTSSRKGMSRAETCGGRIAQVSISAM